MSDMQRVSEMPLRSAEPLTFAQQKILERAVAKIVLIGEMVGVTADQMILLLEAGLTVGELLEYLGLRTREGLGKRGPMELRGEGLKGN
jgi:hypothetical protein